MRNQKERRQSASAPLSPNTDNGHARLLQERRSGRARRLENMSLDERQLQLSEMPGPTAERKR